MSLQGLNIIVTRPKDRAQALAGCLKDAGASVQITPVTDIQPIARTDTVFETPYDAWVFTSVNAVRHSQADWPEQKPDQIFAVGPATAKSLAEFGCEHVIFPTQNPSASSLLSRTELADIQGKRMLVLHGRPHDPMLETILTECGAIVSKLPVYQITPPLDFTPPQLDTPCVILVSSKQSLRNLCTLISNQQEVMLETVTLCVNSQRLADLAYSLGFKRQPIVCSDLETKTIHCAMEAWYATQAV